MASSTDTSDLPAVTYFRKAFLEVADNVNSLFTNEQQHRAKPGHPDLKFKEPVASASLSNESEGVNYDDLDTGTTNNDTTTSDIIDFTYSATVDNDTVTINAQTNPRRDQPNCTWVMVPPLTLDSYRCCW